jgi:predicted TIM-barrel fold metal-dependent hydrolase
MKHARNLAVIFILAGFFQACEQNKQPIIDMHLHAHRIADFSGLVSAPPIPHCVPMTAYPIPEPGVSWWEIFQNPEPPCDAIWSPMNEEELMARTFELMDKHNIVTAVTSGPVVASWMSNHPGRIIPALGYSPVPGSPHVDSLRAWHRRGDFTVLGEITPQYDGFRADSPEMDAVWALAEELDIPVNIHIGTGPVGAPYVVWPNYRAALHSPLQMEEVLLRHPNLRVYIGHAGWPMLDDMLALLWTHPQVYVDISVINWALPRVEFHRYLQRLVESGFGKRILFGSDQMVWPDAIEIAIESIETADFLTAEQKRDIFYNNAARFLGLSDEEIARHHE